MKDVEKQIAATSSHNLTSQDEIPTASPNENSNSSQPHKAIVFRVFEHYLTRAQNLFKSLTPENLQRNQHDYTSKAFLRLPMPLPVDDVVVQIGWEIIMFRSMWRVGMMCAMILGLVDMIIYFFTFAVIYLLLRLRWPELPHLSRMIKYFLNIYQKFWEWLPAQFMLKPNRKTLTQLWWYIYLLISPHSDFETNYMRAWSENAANPSKITLIFVGDEKLSIPALKGDELDKSRLKHLHMFYRVVKLRRGLLEVILPRTLVRIDWVKVEDSSHILGEPISTMDLGRRAGTLVHRFHRQSLIDEASKKIEEKEKELQQTLANNPNNDGVSVGIEFVRQYNRSAISSVVAIPPLASLIFAVVWMSWFLIRKKDNNYDPQAIVSTAFTGASYFLTAGALIIALVAYLDMAVDDSPKLRNLVDAIGSIRQKENKADGKSNATESEEEI